MRGLEGGAEGFEPKAVTTHTMRFHVKFPALSHRDDVKLLSDRKRGGLQSGWPGSQRVLHGLWGAQAMPSEAASAVVKVAMYSPFPLAFSYEGGGPAPLRRRDSMDLLRRRGGRAVGGEGGYLT